MLLFVFNFSFFLYGQIFLQFNPEQFLSFAVEFLKIVLANFHRFGTCVDDESGDMPLMSLFNLNLDALTDQGGSWLISSKLSLIKYHLCVSLSMPHQLLFGVGEVRLSVVIPHDPNELLRSQEVGVRVVRVENLRDIARSTLLF